MPAMQAQKPKMSRAQFMLHAIDNALYTALWVSFFVALLFGVVNGWKRGSTWEYSLGWAAFAVAIVCVEFGSIKKGVHEWKRGARDVAVLCLAVGVIGFFISLFSTFNSAATNIDQKTNDRAGQADAAVQAKKTWETANAKVESERANVTALRAGLAGSVPVVGGVQVLSADQAKQLVTKAKSDRYWDMTDQCTKTTGPKTSAFCNDYRLAEGAISALSGRGDLEARVTKAEETLRAAETEAATAKTAADAAKPVVNKGTPFARFLTTVTSLTMDEAQIFEAGIPSLVLQLFLMLLGLITAGTEDRLDDYEAAGAHVASAPAYRSPYAAPPAPQAPQAVNLRVVQENFDPFGMAQKHVRAARGAA